MKARTDISVSCRIDSGPVTTATGREAQTILALSNAGSKGITSLETFKAGWAVRLGAYVFDLKRMGFAITTTREPHARYTLACSVQILEVTGAAAKDIVAAC